jgi:hypothetical protein
MTYPRLPPAESEAKQAILSDSDSLSTAALITALGEHRRIHRVMGFGRRDDLPLLVGRVWERELTLELVAL